MANIDRRPNAIGRVLTNLTKFAVDSAVNYPPKGFSVLNSSTVMVTAERFRDAKASVLLNEHKKSEDLKLVESLQMKKEKQPEDFTNLTQQSSAYGKCIPGVDPPKDTPDEGIKKSGGEETKKKRIFIRSRL
ncbi:hypothetical protein K2173_007780 [Erythroxylum novogranatense]|uniref:Uncharacterized protein n=1 Tax=Erythroxylum novogranatense TaxID=1862640 RepID=A0AAV8TD17_9ROSI|nr:hypothetical protein K2173_007780 [Erythroxylum novogranatense]